MGQPGTGGSGDRDAASDSRTASSPARSRRRGKRTRSEAAGSSSAQTEEDSHTERLEEADGSDEMRGARQRRSGRTLRDSGTRSGVTVRSRHVEATVDSDVEEGAVRAGVGESAEAKTYSRRQAGRKKKKRSRLDGTQPEIGAAESALPAAIDEETCRESRTSGLVGESEKASHGPATGRLGTPVREAPVLRRNGSLINVTPSKAPNDMWQVAGISEGTLSPNSKRTSPSIRMRFRLTSSAASTPVNLTPSRLKCVASPDSTPGNSPVLSENGEHGDSPLGGCPPPAAVRPGRLDGLGTEHSSEISEPSTSRSRLRGRRRKCDAERPSIATESGVERQSLPDDNTDSSTMEDPDHSWHRSRNFRGRRAVCGRDWYLSGDELDTPSEAETHDKSQEDCDRQPAAAAPKVPRRRGKQKKSRVKTAGAEAQREAGTSSSAGDLPDDADGSTERGEAAGLAARLESVRRQTLRDLRRPGVDGSPAPDPGHCSRRTVGTPEPELEQAPPADQDARDAEAPAGGVTKLTRRALLQESEPLTPRSRKRKRLTLYESDQESDEPPLELKIERHDSQTRTWPKEGASEVFPDGLKIKKRAKHATTPGKRRVKEESDVIHGDLDGEERQSEEMRGSVSPEGKIDMKENDHIVQEDRDGTRRKKKKCKRPRPELVSAAPVGDDDFGSPPALSPALTPSTRGRRKEVSYAELSEDDDAVFELMNQEHAHDCPREAVPRLQDVSAGGRRGRHLPRL